MSEGNQLWQNHEKALEASVWMLHSPFFFTDISSAKASQCG